jgi:hypothetical protein
MERASEERVGGEVACDFIGNAIQNEQSTLIVVKSESKAWIFV